MDNFTLRIKEFRKDKGITQKELARRSGMSQSFISDIENRKFDASLEQLWRIGRALKVCPLSLIECHCKYCEDNFFLTIVPS